MKIIVTAYNSRNKNRLGLNTIKHSNSIQAYLMGRTKTLKEFDKMQYQPDTLTYYVEGTQYYIANKYYKKGRPVLNHLIKNYNTMQLLIHKYEDFKINYAEFKTNKQLFYTKLKIKKKKPKIINGVAITAYRTTWNPEPALKELQQTALYILSGINLNLKPHNTVHSYREGRSNITNAAMHKFSNHFIKMDIENYFDNINAAVFKKQLSFLSEFAIIHIEDRFLDELGMSVKRRVKKFLDAIIDIAELNGTLPQGSPLSPMLSNFALIEFDMAMNKHCLEKSSAENTIMYTRFSDDLTFSSFGPINKDLLVSKVKELIRPFKIKDSKTQYLKNTKRLYITGVKLNSLHSLTYGHEKVEILKQNIFNILLDRKNNKPVDRKRAEKVLGDLSYMKMIQPHYAKLIRLRYARKFNIPPLEFNKIMLGNLSFNEIIDFTYHTYDTYYTTATTPTATTATADTTNLMVE